MSMSHVQDPMHLTVWASSYHTFPPFTILPFIAPTVFSYAIQALRCCHTALSISDYKFYGEDNNNDNLEQAPPSFGPT